MNYYAIKESEESNVVRNIMIETPDWQYVLYSWGSGQWRRDPSGSRFKLLPEYQLQAVPITRDEAESCSQAARSSASFRHFQVKPMSWQLSGQIRNSGDDG